MQAGRGNAQRPPSERDRPAANRVSRMTWSIIARDASGRFGIAAASRFFAVGVRLPFIEAGVGAVATQALVNSLYGTNGLRLLRDIHPPEQEEHKLVACVSCPDHAAL